MNENFDVTEETAYTIDEEKQRLERRAKRREEMRREKERQAKMRKAAVFAVPGFVVLVVAIVLVIKFAGASHSDVTNSQGAKADEIVTAEVSAPSIEPIPEGDNISEAGQNVSEATTENTEAEEGTVEKTGNENAEGADSDGENPEGEAAIPQIRPLLPDAVTTRYSAKFTSATEGIDEEEVKSTYAVIFDLESGEALAAQGARTRINPASMTKILTVLVAADYIDNLDDKFTVTIDITDYSYSHDCSAVGFAQDEVVTVRDLLYGTILPSGADAAVGLATYVAGSQEAFVELMNKKIKDLGLSSSHMTNCVGLYDENHYSTLYDIGMMLQAAINNDLCREVMKAHTYVTSSTPEHPDGISISNWFLRRIEDKDTHGEVMCAKTGFVVQSRNCAASYAIDHAGKGYICVTADAYNSWRAIYDHVALYQKYLE